MNGPQVEAGLAAGAGGHPRLVDLDQGAQRGEEVLLGQLGQGHPAGAALHPLGVGLRAEGPDRAVRVPVGLHALEDLLGVVQHRGRRHQR